MRRNLPFIRNFSRLSPKCPVYSPVRPFGGKDQSAQFSRPWIQGNRALSIYFSPYQARIKNNTGLIKREPGERRWGMPAEFPLTGGSDVHVMLDRRSGVDRRVSPADLDDLLILFSQLPSIEPGRKQ